MRTTLRTLVTLTTTAAALLLPAAATAAVPAGSCEHPLGADRANVAYQWKSRSNAWRIRPALVTVKTTTGPGRGAKNGTLTQSTEHTGIEAWYLVLNARQVGSRCYLQVRLPAAPRLRSGWVDRDYVIAQRLRWQVEIDLSDRRVRMYRGTRLVLNRPVVIGKPSTPTPKSPSAAPFAIYDAKRGDASDFTGTWQIATTEHSRVDEGLGRIGLHGRGGESLKTPLGTAASHGCVRAANATVDAIVRKAGLRGLLGVPVVIRA
ncbi:MAG: L,D-transpeptidase [Thermoleophilia bacterium]|nr:L,D-transpeptidase [Thermoleophilia bacterium]